MVNGVPAQKHHYNVPWVIFAVVIALCVVAYLYWKYQVPVDRVYRAGQAPEEAIEERDPTLSPIRDVSEGASAVSNPLEDVPSINPIEATNPFKGKINPFD